MATAVKIQMVARGLSQSRIVAETGVDRATVSKLVNGKLRRGAEAQKAAKVIARELRCAVADLFPWLEAS